MWFFGTNAVSLPSRWQFSYRILNLSVMQSCKQAAVNSLYYDVQLDIQTIGFDAVRSTYEWSTLTNDEQMTLEDLVNTL